MDDVKVEAASSWPCSACPWRIENHGKRNAGGWYTKANLRRLWAGLRRGAQMTCHPTDSRMNDDPGMPRPVPEGTQPRECAGSLLLVQRELRIVETLVHDGHSDAAREYRRRRPRGLTRDGLAVNVGRIAYTLPGEIPFIAVTDTPEVGYPEIEHANG